jgi:hypothetical protein
MPKIAAPDAINLNGRLRRIHQIKLGEFDTANSLNLEALIIANQKIDTMLNRQYPDTPIIPKLKPQATREISLRTKHLQKPAASESRAITRAVETASTALATH